MANNSIQLSRRTVYGIALQASQYFKTPLIIKPHTTLNEKFEINAAAEITNTNNLSVKYVCIGNGGHTLITGANGVPKIVPQPHTPRHSALYNHLPFIMRKPDDDLLPTERLRYRLRRLEVHDGVTYVAYYARVLDLSETVTQMELRTIDQDNVTSSPFVPSLSDLHPTPPVINTNNAVITTGDYVSAVNKVPFVLTVDEIDEFMNVCNVIYGDPGYAIISEIAICSGEDKAVTGDFNGTQANYIDAVGVQVANFISTGILCSFINQNVNMTLDVGSNEPLLDLA